MTEPRRLALATAACFFLSGAPALVDQVVWARAFSRVFGSSTQAVATVLAGFMVGLALGSFLAARLSHRMKRPLLVYAALEAGIAVYAAASMQIIEATAALADEALAAPGIPAAARTAGLFLTSFLLLLPPTTLMGATLPVLVALVPRNARLSLSMLYGANTLGAAAGALAGGFLLLPALGFQRTLLLSAGLNLLVAALASLLARGTSPVDAAVAVAATPVPAPVPALLLLFVAASGTATMAYEIALTRATALLFGSSTYSFALVLAAFLAGIGLGGALDHRRGLAEGLPSARQVPLLTALGALSVILVSAAMTAMPAVSFQLHRAFAGRFSLMQASVFLILALLAMAPAMTLGMSFPGALRGLVPSLGGWSRAVGTGTAVNTLGAGIGAIGCGFFLLPLVGLERLLQGAALGMGLLAVALELSLPRASRRIALVGGIVAAAVLLSAVGPGWPRKALAMGMFRSFKLVGTYAEMRGMLDVRELLYDVDGPAASVAVMTNPGGVLSLRVNGKADASTDPLDIPTQLLSSLLPAMVHGSPERVLVIGLGSGATAHAALDWPTVAHVDVAEIEPRVAEAADLHFQPLNRGVLHDPRVRLHVEDGRRFVRRSREPYDVIVSEPSNPWIAGVADLYTVEHMRRVAGALAEDGVFVQWIQGYSLSHRFVLATLRTVAEVMPEVTLWFTNGSDFLIVASRRPVSLDLDAVRAALAGSPHLDEELRSVDVQGPRGLASRYLCGSAEVRRLAAGAPVMHDDHPILEYQAPRELHAETVQSNWDIFLAAAVPCPTRGATLPPAEEAQEWLLLSRSADACERTELAREALEAHARLVVAAGAP